MNILHIVVYVIFSISVITAVYVTRVLLSKKPVIDKLYSLSIFVGIVDFLMRPFRKKHE